MSKVIVFDNDGTRLFERPLDQERITIGRNDASLIRLDNPTVSAEHALIITIRNDSFLEDLDSTNGTRVNGKLIKKCLLHDGDEIRVARYVIKYVFAPTQETPKDIEDTVPALSPPLAEPTLLEIDVPASLERRSQAASSTSSTLHDESSLGGIRILTGPGMGKEVDLSKKLTTLGKPGLQVGVITRRAQGYFLTHIEGNEFPLVNGNIVGLHPHPLQDHDIIELAGTKLEFFFKQSPAT
jgi:pSer/pThr/pTyr-binding forkhead associated (FHA) protein